MNNRKNLLLLNKRRYQTAKDLTLENYARRWEKVIAEAIEILKDRDNH